LRNLQTQYNFFHKHYLSQFKFHNLSVYKYFVPIYVINFKCQLINAFFQVRQLQPVESGSAGVKTWRLWATYFDSSKLALRNFHNRWQECSQSNHGKLPTNHRRVLIDMNMDHEYESGAISHRHIVLGTRRGKWVGRGGNLAALSDIFWLG
jgi:hypothetical protein